MASKVADNKAGEGVGRMVLVVEDDDVLRMVLRFEMEKQGYEVIEAVHGADALDRMRESRFSLVITDLMMPVMDGLAFIAEVRRSFSPSDVPVIAISAVKEIEMGQEALRRGANLFMQKPFTTEQLMFNIGTLDSAGH